MLRAARQLVWVLIALGAMAPISRAQTPVDPPDSFRERPESPVAAPQRRILLLHSYTNRVRYTRLQDTALREGIARGYPGPLHFYTVELDFNLDEEMESWSSVHEFLRKRYESRGLDLVVATDTPALRFLELYGAGTFPNVPIVFSASKEAPAEAMRATGQITGVVESLDVRGTIELIQRLHPGTRQLLVINNKSVHGDELRTLTEQALASMGNTLSATWLMDLGVEEIERRIAAAPADSAILFLTYWDLTGKRSTLEGTLGQFCRVSPRPTYVLFDAYVGIGPVGGRVASAAAYGKRAAQMAVEVLLGKKASEIPMIASVNPVTLDARQLERFAVPSDAIPADAEVLFPQQSFFERNGQIIGVAASAVIAQGIIIGVLILNRQRLRRATADLRASELRFRMLGEHLPGMPYSMVRLASGRRFAEYLGPGLESLVGPDAAAVIRADFDRFFDFVHPDDFDSIVNERLACIRDRRPFDCEYRLRRPDGQWRWVRACATATHLPDGAVRWHGVILDIDTEKRNTLALRASEERFRALGENLPGLAFTTFLDPSGARSAEYLGPGLEQLLGPANAAIVRADVSKFAQFIHPDDRAGAAAAREGAIRERRPFDCEYRIMSEDGSWRWIRATASPTFLPDGSMRWHGVLLDISEAKTAEQRLRLSEEQYRLVFEATSDVLWDWDLRQNTIRWSALALSTFGMHGDSLVTDADSCFSRIHPDDVKRVADGIDRMLRGEIATWRGEYRFRKTDGNYLFVADRASSVRDSAGRATRVIGAMTDITTLRETERRLRTALEAGSMASWEWDIDEGMIHHSDGMGPMFNLPAGAGSTPQQRVLEQIVPEDRPVKLAAVLDACEKPDGALSVDYRVARPDGTIRWLSCQGRAVLHAGKSGRRILGVTLDITRLMAAKAALRESETRLRAIIQTLPVAVIIHDGKSIYFANQAAAELCRCSRVDDLLATPIVNLIDPKCLDECAERIRLVLDEGVCADRTELVMRAVDGGTFEAEVRCMPIEIDGVRRVQTTILDLTERRRTEQTLQRTSRTQHLLLSELDHRVKNSLASLLTLIELTRTSTADIPAFADSIRARVMAMASVHNLLSESNWSPVSLTRMVTSLQPPDVVGQIVAEGAPIEIPARQSTAMAMIIQELFTNSLKHGAAAEPNGQVRIRWTFAATDPGAPGGTLTLEWRESGGPPIRNPVQPGVGTRLIQGFCSFELHGSCDLRYTERGADHRLVFALDAEALPMPDLKPTMREPLPAGSRR